MADVVDRAADAESAFIANALQAQRERAATGMSLSECTDCDAPIPLARQRAVQGCTRCVSCAGALERTR